MITGNSDIGTYGFAPGMRQAVFVPDQLIAGNLKIVTDQVNFAKADALLMRGTLVGQVTETGLFVVSVATATDGSQIPSGIVVDTVDATEDTASGAVYLMGEFNVRYMSFDDSWAEDKLVAACRQNNLFIKRSVSNDML